MLAPIENLSSTSNKSNIVGFISIFAKDLSIILLSFIFGIFIPNGICISLVASSKSVYFIPFSSYNLVTSLILVKLAPWSPYTTIMLFCISPVSSNPSINLPNA